MIESGQDFFLNMSVLLLGLGFMLFFWAGPQVVLIREAVLWSAVVTGCAYIGYRYWAAWPMTPMYIGTVAVVPILTFLGLVTTHRLGAPPALLVRRGAVTIALGLGMAAILFPKDFYLPFLKTISIFSHFHLIFTVLGKAALILAGLWAYRGWGIPVVWDDLDEILTGIAAILHPQAYPDHELQFFANLPDTDPAPKTEVN